MPEVELEVTILNVHYTLRGFRAIEDLEAWLNEHASEARSDSDDCAAPAPVPTPSGEQ